MKTGGVIMRVVLAGDKCVSQICSTISSLVSVLHNFDADFGLTKCYISGGDAKQIQDVAEKMFGQEKNYRVRFLQSGAFISFVS